MDRLEHGDGAVLSSRFTKGGRVDKYPLQRQIISRSGTIAANLVLGLGQYVEDMTSGYEAFQDEVLGDLFSNYPIENWISVTKGPGHFYQTEMRTLVIWRGHNVGIVPIVWGSDRMEEPTTLPIKTVLKAFRSLAELRTKRAEMIKKK